MWRIRLFEERVAELKRSLQVHGLIHLSIGGEGVAAAVCRQLRDDERSIAAIAPTGTRSPKVRRWTA